MFKNLIATFVLIMVLLASCEKMTPYHEDGSEITAAEAVKIVRPLIEKYATEGRSFFVGKNPIPAQTTLKYGPNGLYDSSWKECGTFKSPNYKAWLIFIESDININGSSEKQLHIFVDVLTGKYIEMYIEGQVSGIELDESFFTISDNSYTGLSYNPSTTAKKSSTTTRMYSSPRRSSSTSGLYAVIISGGINMTNNKSRYWNDCQYIYQRLTQSLGYDESHIYCLVADGTDPAIDMRISETTYISSPLDFDNDGDNDIQYSATKANISTVFNLLHSQVSSIDHLLVFVTDHGSQYGLCLWGDNQIMSPAEFNAELDKLPSVRMDVVMGQCNSGIFVSPLNDNNRTVSTACSATENSFGNGYQYDYFLRAWTDAFDPTNASTVDTNSDNMISLREVFLYAESHDPKAVDNIEHPQYASQPLIYGYTHDLLGTDNRPVISGSDYLSCSVSSSYTISGLPSSTSVTWTSSSDINLSSLTNTSVNAQGSLPTTSYVSQHGYIIANFTLEGTQYFVLKDILSIWKPGYYFGYNHIFGGSGEYTVETGEGAYDYEWESENDAWVILTSPGSPHVYVYEGSTSDPVILWVSFRDPWGNSIVTGQEFNSN